MNKHSRKVKVTKHAEKRLHERAEELVKRYPSIPILAQSARYNGKCIYELNDEEYAYYNRHIYAHNKNDMIILFKGVWFVFAGNHGHHRTLITVFTYK